MVRQVRLMSKSEGSARGTLVIPRRTAIGAFCDGMPQFLGEVTKINLRKLTNTVVVLTAALFVWSCAQAPVQNIDDEAIVSRSALLLDEVETAILKAGRIRGWKMKPVEPGHIVATLDIRKHQAVADILYDTDNYSIHYRDSTNLEYDGNNINRHYNRWIVNLSIDIQRALPL